MALVDEAAREGDTTGLTRLCAMDCDPKVQAPLWQKPGTLAQLSSLIEKGAKAGSAKPHLPVSGAYGGLCPKLT